MIVEATYKGYYGPTFLFETEHRTELKLMYHEMCGAFNIDPIKLAKIMQKYIGKKYQIALYWNNYGYHLKQRKDKTYELYDSVTLIPVGVSYNAIEGIPDQYEGKPIQRYKKRIVLRRLPYDTNKHS